MDLKFEIAGRIAKPVAAVFEAVADPQQLSQYFTTGGAKGRLQSGNTVSWDFHDFPGAFPVDVIEVEPNRRIVLRWAAADGSNPAETGQNPEWVGYQTTVTMNFEPLTDGRTLVRIAETGWQDTPAGLAACLNNCQGWSQMLCALKIWLEHGINLREGFYK